MDIDLTKQQDRVKCLVPYGSMFLKTSLKIANFATDKAMLVDAIWDTASTRSCVSQRVADALALDIRGGGSVVGIGGRVKAGLTFALAFPGNTDWYTIARPMVRPITDGVDFLIGLDIITMGDLSLKHGDNGTLLEFVFDQQYFVNAVEDNVRTAFEKMKRIDERLRNFK